MAHAAQPLHLGATEVEEKVQESVVPRFPCRTPETGRVGDPRDPRVPFVHFNFALFCICSMRNNINNRNPQPKMNDQKQMNYFASRYLQRRDIAMDNVTTLCLQLDMLVIDLILLAWWRFVKMRCGQHFYKIRFTRHASFEILFALPLEKGSTPNLLAAVDQRK